MQAAETQTQQSKMQGSVKLLDLQNYQGHRRAKHRSSRCL